MTALEYRGIDVPDWMYPPRESGWEAADLDDAPELPAHTELIDGALVFMMSPQRSRHGDLVGGLWFTLRRQAPQTFAVKSEMTITLGKRDRPEPDVLVINAAADHPDATSYHPDDVHVAIEVESPESRSRDRDTKPHKYARAGIRHYWRVEEREGTPFVHIYELDPVTNAYVHTGSHPKKFSVAQPFAATVDLAEWL